MVRFDQSHCDKPYTIAEIIENLKSEYDSDSIPGRSTVYRLIDKMVEEGAVKRFNMGHYRHFYYQIVTSHKCHDHIHMKCTKCGKLLHMDDSETEKLLREVLKNTHFKVNREETTLLGLCDDCDQI